jgi:hypothetical protein
LAEGLCPGAVAMAVFDLADETVFATGGDFFFEGTEIGAEGGVVGDAEMAVFEFAAEGEGHFFFERGGEGDGFDFVTEVASGVLGEFDAHAAGVDASASNLREFEQTPKWGADFFEGFVVDFDAETIVGDGADFFANVDDGEIADAGYIETQIELGRFGGDAGDGVLVSGCGMQEGEVGF